MHGQHFFFLKDKAKFFKYFPFFSKIDKNRLLFHFFFPFISLSIFRYDFVVFRKHLSGVWTTIVYGLDLFSFYSDIFRGFLDPGILIMSPYNSIRVKVALIKERVSCVQIVKERRQGIVANERKAKRLGPRGKGALSSIQFPCWRSKFYTAAVTHSRPI